MRHYFPGCEVYDDDYDVPYDSGAEETEAEYESPYDAYWNYEPMAVYDPE